MQSSSARCSDNVTLGFTQPYLFDLPLQAGISVYLRRFNYDQGRQDFAARRQNLRPSTIRWAAPTF
jgi:hypothetical protein